jgi:hypothetical protein
MSDDRKITGSLAAVGDLRISRADMRAAIKAGDEDMKAGRTKTFTGDEFATYLIARAEQAIRKTRDE